MNKHRTCTNQWLRTLHLRGRKKFFDKTAFIRCSQSVCDVCLGMADRDVCRKLHSEAAICFFQSSPFYFKRKGTARKFSSIKDIQMTSSIPHTLVWIHSANTLIDFHWLGLRTHEEWGIMCEKILPTLLILYDNTILKSIFQGQGDHTGNEL